MNVTICLQPSQNKIKMSEKINKNRISNDISPILCDGYSTASALEIMNRFNAIKDSYTKLRFISKCSGIELVIKDRRYWFEFFGKQITETDIYIPDSSFARMLDIACS